MLRVAVESHFGCEKFLASLVFQELEHLIDEYENLPSGSREVGTSKTFQPCRLLSGTTQGLDPKTVTIAAQV